MDELGKCVAGYVDGRVGRWVGGLYAMEPGSTLNDHTLFLHYDPSPT